MSRHSKFKIEALSRSSINRLHSDTNLFFRY